MRLSVSEARSGRAGDKHGARGCEEREDAGCFHFHCIFLSIVVAICC